MARAERQAVVATNRNELVAAIQQYEEVVRIDARHAEAHVNLAHLYLLLGDGYTSRRSAQRKHFRAARRHAEAAMFANPAFRERIRDGEPTWVACKALGAPDIDAMFFWVNAVFYQFKETMQGPSQALNIRWIRRARQVMDHMARLTPDDDMRLPFLLGAYYLSIPTAMGGNREYAKAWFDTAVENAPNLLLPRWGRAKYYHFKMNNPVGFREDLIWVMSQTTDAMQDHPAWRHFFIEDARRMLMERVSPFRHRTGVYRRRILEHWPASPWQPGSRPVVIILHGAFSTGREMDLWGEWSARASREGFGVVFPEGIGLLGRLQHWNAGHCCGRAARKNWDDTAFLDAVIDYLCARPDVNPQRILMVGFSNGGMMVHHYATQRPERLAAAAVVAGALNSLESPGAKPWKLAQPKTRVPILLVHGTADVVVPVEGGAPLDGRNERNYASLDDAVDFWRRVNQTVGPAEQITRYGSAVPGKIYRDHDNRAMVAAYRIQEWGHQWPGGIATRNLDHGHPLEKFDVAETIWDFFSRSGLPREKRSRSTHSISASPTSFENNE